MVSSQHQQTTLHLIFSVFLGLMLTSFIGVGVYTFYPHRLEPFHEQLRVLRDQKQLIIEGRGVEGLTTEQRAEVATLKTRSPKTSSRRAAAPWKLGWKRSNAS